MDNDTPADAIAPLKSDLVEAFDMAHALIQEAKPREGYITDHLDAAENWLDTAQEIALAAMNTRTTSLAAQDGELVKRLQGVYGKLTPGAIDSADLDGMAFTVADAIKALAAQDGLVDALRKALHRLVVAAEEDINRDEPEGVDGSEIDAANNAILNSYPQVFTDEQVAKLTGWQECELTHSLSCPNGPHGFHDDDGTPLPDDLFAHSNGLFCPHCDYRQDWAPDVCFGPLPQLPDSFRAALASIEVKSDPEPERSALDDMDDDDLNDWFERGRD